MYNLDNMTSLKRQWLLRNSNIPRRFIGMGPEEIVKKMGSFPEEIEYWLEDVMAGDIIKQLGGLGTTGVGLLFDGGPGLGKTTHAVTALMELIHRLPDDEEQARNVLAMSSTTYGMNARPIYYMTFPEFLSRKKAMFDADPETKQKIFMEIEGLHGRLPESEDHMNVRVLVLDDLGKEYGSEYNDSSFDEILRSRYDKALPTIITTNVVREAWAGQYGEAMGSFAHEAFRRVKITGEDIRKQ